MTKQQFETFMDYIDARIDEKIEAAAFRDTLLESIYRADIKADLEKLMIQQTEDPHA